MKKELKNDGILNFSPSKLQIRASETVSIAIPSDTLHSLQRVAASRAMSVDALLKFYIGQCLRQDLDKLFGQQILAATTEVLKERLSTEAEVAEIMQSIHRELQHAA